MSDRDLLDAAARAAGIELTGGYAQAADKTFAFYRAPSGHLIPWAPLTDDGDEARLEAALGLAVEWDEYWVCVGEAWELFANHGGDKQAARRRAGVRAAAALTQPEGGA